MICICGFRSRRNFVRGTWPKSNASTSLLQNHGWLSPDPRLQQADESCAHCCSRTSVCTALLVALPTIHLLELTLSSSGRFQIPSTSSRPGAPAPMGPSISVLARYQLDWFHQCLTPPFQRCPGRARSRCRLFPMAFGSYIALASSG
jgi:hypothetical protein